jgi:hypothetical protein
VRPCSLLRRHSSNLNPTDTSEEQHKFFHDATRLAQDISGNQTFHTVKPILNFWAAFTPSKEVIISPSAVSFILKIFTQSGVGIGGTPKE